jgi:hypothetical protein
MRLTLKAAALFVLFAAAILLLALQQPSNSSAASFAPSQSASEDAIPAYHPQPPTSALPATMSSDNFTDPLVQNAYKLSSRVEKVLYQQPCYCHCDRSQGHESLLDCFVSKHGSGCGICIREDLYSYEQTHKGKTPSQIRDGIVAGEWQSVDISKYQTPVPTTQK